MSLSHLVRGIVRISLRHRAYINTHPDPLLAHNGAVLATSKSKLDIVVKRRGRKDSSHRLSF
jgi:hypothetical protein